MTQTTVLVTGGSGYIALECIGQLLRKDYSVKTTVRSLKRKEEVINTLKAAGTADLEKLQFVEADLLQDAGWADAVRGCRYVLHVASPFPLGAPKHEDDLIVPAREGTLRVLRASRDAGIKRVVLTSSFAAIGYGPDATTKTLTEVDWSDEGEMGGKEIPPYPKSKTMAERAAWKFVETEGRGLELSVINPVGVFGPVHGTDFSTSIEIVLRLMNGSLPGCPQVQFGIVDVRDVATLHIIAMTKPEAKNERFLAVAGETMTILEVAQVLRSRLGSKARKVPTRQLPNFLLRLAALFDPAVALILPELGKKKACSNEKARSMLEWSPISREDALVATAESLMQLGLIKL